MASFAGPGVSQSGSKLMSELSPDSNDPEIINRRESIINRVVNSFLDPNYQYFHPRRVFSIHNRITRTKYEWVLFISLQNFREICKGMWLCVCVYINEISCICDICRRTQERWAAMSIPREERVAFLAFTEKSVVNDIVTKGYEPRPLPDTLNKLGKYVNSTINS